jgi:hypothetical protein
MITSFLANIPWIIGGIVLGVIFDEFFRALWKKIKARGVKVVDDIRDR